MKRNLAIYNVVLLTFLGIFAVCAEDKSIVLKKNGLSYVDMWNEKDVEKYLNLPRLNSKEGIVGVSINDIARRFEAVQTLAGFQLVKDNDSLSMVKSNDYPVIAFELRRKDFPVIKVNVYDYKSWNILCDKLYKHITNTIDLWNKIPNYYTTEVRNDTYTLIRSGNQTQKWQFDLKQHYIISLNAITSNTTNATDVKVLVEMDNMLLELVNIIKK
jgi:hypothetical protein